MSAHTYCQVCPAVVEYAVSDQESAVAILARTSICRAKEDGAVMDMHVALRLLILGIILICVLTPMLSLPGTTYGPSSRLP
jgi:hypothetical protein